MLGVCDTLLNHPKEECEEVSSRTVVTQVSSATGFALVCTAVSSELHRILIDTGSQRSFITNRLSKRLKAKVPHKDFLINHTLGGIASEVAEFKNYSVSLKSRFGSEERFNIECLGIPEITKSIFPRAESIKNIKRHADFVSNPEHEEIDVLLGADNIGAVWLSESLTEGTLVGINTKLGWFTFGKKVPQLQLSTSLFAQQETVNEPAEESSVNNASDPTTEKTSQDIEFLFRLVAGYRNCWVSSRRKTTSTKRHLRNRNTTRFSKRSSDGIHREDIPFYCLSTESFQRWVRTNN